MRYLIITCVVAWAIYQIWVFKTHGVKNTLRGFVNWTR